MAARCISAAAFFGLFMLFLLPVSRNIINIGNGIGMAVSALMVLILLFWNRFSIFVGRCWEKPLGKLLVGVVGGVAAVSVVTAAVISVFMIKAANDRPKNENTTLVVLGCQVRDGAPSLMLSRRLKAAYDYLSGHESVKVVVSGGKGEDESISEAQCMRDWLVGNGIAPERIYMEDKSVNTEENLSFSKKIIDENGLPADITIVTDGFHQLRADILAEKTGIESHNISARTAWYLLPTYWVREWFGVLYYKLF
ncbi:MAG: YdcF family protein [Ruminococcus sp.]|uniref:YdcF family protein n=1 Tax=Ruminococcus sp. TaxID=41978 RepID=UPI0025DEC2F6|nr:YdcF family protein [Ruminococcus sp.]MBR5682350.1 YdcF family protein [Ruminococcus sp.]